MCFLIDFFTHRLAGGKKPIYVARNTAQSILLVLNSVSRRAGNIITFCRMARKHYMLKTPQSVTPIYCCAGSVGFIGYSVKGDAIGYQFTFVRNSLRIWDPIFSSSFFFSFSIVTEDSNSNTEVYKHNKIK